MGFQSELAAYYIREALKEYLSDSDGNIDLEKKRFLDDLHAKEVITALELAQIRTLETSGNGVNGLIDIMSRGSVKKNFDFLQCLQKAGRMCDGDNTAHTGGQRYCGETIVIGISVIVLVSVLLYPFNKPDPRLPIAQRFREEYSRIPQWTSPDAWPVLQENIYTPMTWVMIDRTGFKVAEETLDDYHQLFTKTKEEPLYVVIIGESGIGKTTFIRHFAHTWAASVINPGSLNPGTLAVMKQFDYIFPLNLIDLEPNDNLFSFVRNHFSFLQHRLLETMLRLASVNPHRSLCILDGYNDMTRNPPQEISDMIEKKNAPFCLNLIITAREDKAVYLRQHLGLTGREALLRGFNIEQTKEFVNKCNIEDDTRSTNLIKYLQTDEENREFARTPLLLQMLCALPGRGDYERLMHYYGTRFMESLIIMLRRYHTEKKHGNSLSMDQLLDVYVEQLKGLGRLGWSGCSQEMYKCPSAFTLDTVKAVAGEEVLSLGVLKYITPDNISTPAKVRFPSDFFQEFIIALSHHLGNTELMPGIVDKDLFEFVKSEHARSDKELPLFINEGRYCKVDQEGKCDHYKSYNGIRVHYLMLTQYKQFRSIWLEFGYKGTALFPK